MKTSSCIAAAALVLGIGACAPQTFVMSLETLQPSLSGMELAGKSISVAYVDGRDSVFSKNLATGFAETIERDYFDGKQAVSLYRMTPAPGADFSSRDTLVNLVVDSGHDVVFLFDEPIFNEPVFGQRRATTLGDPDSAHIVTARVPYELRMYAYDALNKADTVRIFAGASALDQTIYASALSTDADLLRHLWDDPAHTAEQAGEAGVKSAAKFRAVWKAETWSFYYYDSSAWLAALEAVFTLKWQEAMNGWMDIASRCDGEPRACAEYNLAAACYLMGDYELALKWLELSDKDGKVILSDGLHKRIAGRGIR